MKLSDEIDCVSKMKLAIFRMNLDGILRKAHRQPENLRVVLNLLNLAEGDSVRPPTRLM